MNRILLTLALISSASVATAQQQMITFDDIPPGLGLNAAVPVGFSLVGPGSIDDGALRGMGGDAIAVYLASSTGYTLNSLDLASRASTNNRIVLRGYTLGDIEAWTVAHPFPLFEGFFHALHIASDQNVYPASTYFLEWVANPSSFQRLTLEWSNLGAFVIDSRGGDPMSPVSNGWPGYEWLADNISVTVTPEPGSMVLVATGLLLIAAAARRRLVRR